MCDLHSIVQMSANAISAFIKRQSAIRGTFQANPQTAFKLVLSPSLPRSLAFQHEVKCDQKRSSEVLLGAASHLLLTPFTAVSP